MGLIFDIKKYALHDGPGIRTTIFFKGCPLACPWCHNPEGKAAAPELMWSPDRCLHCSDCLEACPRKALSFTEDRLTVDCRACNGCGTCTASCTPHALEMVGTEKTVDDILKEIEKDVLFYDESGGGVTFSGGEPLMQTTFLKTLLHVCRDFGIHTAVDTCGFASPRDILKLAPDVDLFLYDLKVINNEKHTFLTGKSNELILQNLELLIQQQSTLWVRYPVIPSYNESDEDIQDLGNFLTSLGVPTVTLLPYHAAGTHKVDRLLFNHSPPCAIQPPSEARMNQISAKLKGFGLHVMTGG
ncbi:MAG: glycyl-radical enzyme activating protein [Theionarchaea archaeon]|nr:glycyl-radical enzyme activating protein [Theionarchaea archaeon]